VLHACTIVARNYLAHARTLAASYREHHPGGRFSVLVLDAPYEHLLRDDDAFDVIEPTQIGLPEGELERMLTLYDVKELATALKPTLLDSMLAAGATAALYLDPDIVVFDELDVIGELAARHGIVLTPHTLEPLPRDYREPSEHGLNVAGVFNLGFVCVGEGGRPFLSWWAERLARDCVESAEPGLFVDQKWVDFVPCYWEHHVLRDRGCNVAYWNLPTRRVAGGPGAWTVDGVPLRFFHYSGYSPTRPEQLSKFQTEPQRVTFDEFPLLRVLCDDYAARLAANGFAECSPVPYAFDAPGGVVLTRPLRRMYRQLLKVSEYRGFELPANPFADGAQAWLEMLQSVSADLAPERLGGSLQTRRLAVLAFAEELADDDTLLAAWNAAFDADADATLVILAEGDADAATNGVLAAMERAGIDADAAPDMLLLAATPFELPPAGDVQAVYTRRAPRGALLGLPHADDPTALAPAA
jgi:hypothetical protein